MTDTELLAACKIGLNISASTTALDGIITQKLLAVKGFLTNAGVSAAEMDSDLAVGCIVMGVADIWQLEGGEVKFSPVFYVLLSQLAAKSTAALYFRVTYNGNGSTSGGVPVDSLVYGQGEYATVLNNLGSLARTGYTFGGWNTKTDGTGTTYAGGSTYTVGVANATLYARWTA